MDLRNTFAVCTFLLIGTTAAAQPAKPTIDSRWNDLASPDDGKATRALLALAGKFGGAGDARTGRNAMVDGLRAAVNPDEATQGGLALKISVSIAAGARALAAAGKLCKDNNVAGKAVLYAGNGVVVLYAAAEGEAAHRLIAGAKGVGQSAGGYTAPIRVHHTVLSGWGSRVDPALHRFVLQPIKEKLDPSGVFPPIV